MATTQIFATAARCSRRTTTRLPFTALLRHKPQVSNTNFFQLHRRAFATMPAIADGVEFDTIAREWRCKWSPDSDKASLVAAQKAIESVLAEVKAVDGVKGVNRIVCGGCMDFKIITSLPADKFGDWEKSSFAPEAAFLDKLKGIDGITDVETQTYTIMPM